MDINEINPIKPKALSKGDNIALIAPAGPVNEVQLTTAQKNIQELGFNSYFTDRILLKKGYLAGNDNERLNDLHEAFENTEIDAILCIRGGYGSARIIEQIDYSLIKRNPKIFIGYSDITALINAFWQKTGLICFHGVVGNSTFSPYTKNCFLQLMTNNLKSNKIVPLNNNKTFSINQGIAKGKLVGGNLAIINTLIGTQHQIDFTDKIVFLEDIGEAPYKIDRMLTQLLQTGQLQKAKGIILGEFYKCDIDNIEISADNSLSLKEVLNDRLEVLNIPIIGNFSFGHISNQAIFPVGIEAEIDTECPEVRLCESIFSNKS